MSNLYDLEWTVHTSAVSYEVQGCKNTLSNKLRIKEDPISNFNVKSQPLLGCCKLEYTFLIQIYKLVATILVCRRLQSVVGTALG